MCAGGSEKPVLIVRAFAAAIKPILVGGAVTASAATGVAVWQYAQNDGQTTFERLQSAGIHLVVSEFGDTADTIVAIDPEDPQSREEIAVIDHAPGWGIFASLAPDGGAIAYTALPADGAKPSPDTPAIAAIVDAGGDVQQLATDVDLLVAPIWSPDGSSIVVRKNTPAEDSAGSFELVLLGRDGARSTITSWRSAAVFPMAFSPDGAQLYFATLNASGSDLYRVAPDGSGETLIAHLSDDIARDWQLSPDGGSVAYTVLESGGAPRTKTMVLELSTGVATEALDMTNAEYNPAWRADGDLTVAAVVGAGSIALSVDGAGEAATVTGRRGAIELPLSWAPDDSTLALRTIEGASPLDAGASHIELLDEDGERTPISDGPDVAIVGWLQ
jgi:Tol biopolymer transport system component